MKNKKCPKVKAPKVKAPKIKVSKKKNLSWLFIVAAIITVVVGIVITANEFITAPRCGDHCANYFSYLTFHYTKLITLFGIIAGALLLIAALAAILPRKNKKAVAPTTCCKAVLEPQVLVKGVFEKKAWPWLFVVAAILFAVVMFSLYAIEFSTASRCGNHCSTYYDYITIHYKGLVNLVAVVSGALILVAILSALLFVRKRSLIVTPDELIYKKGRKNIVIPFETIQNVNFTKSGIAVKVPHVKFNFAQLKNKKEVYDTVISQTNAPACVTTTTVVAPSQSLTALAAPLLANPTLQGKLAYFGKLRESGLITAQQYDKYVQQSYKADN